MFFCVTIGTHIIVYVPAKILVVRVDGIEPPLLGSKPRALSIILHALTQWRKTRESLAYNWRKWTDSNPLTHF